MLFSPRSPILGKTLACGASIMLAATASPASAHHGRHTEIMSVSATVVASCSASTRGSAVSTSCTVGVAPPPAASTAPATEGTARPPEEAAPASPRREGGYVTLSY